MTRTGFANIFAGSDLFAQTPWVLPTDSGLLYNRTCISLHPIEARRGRLRAKHDCPFKMGGCVGRRGITRRTGIDGGVKT